MAKSALGFQIPVQLAIALNAVTPDPGGASAAGVMVWSTTTGNYVKWTGTAWTAVDTTGGGGAASISTAIITAPYPTRELVATVVDAAVTVASKIILAHGMYLDTDANVPEDVDISIIGVPLVGSFKVRLTAKTAESIGGPFKISYLLG